MNNQEIVAKLWNLCNVLRDDGITYQQYVTELTYILFLKMCKETDTEKAILHILLHIRHIQMNSCLVHIRRYELAIAVIDICFMLPTCFAEREADTHFLHAIRPFFFKIVMQISAFLK